MKAIREKLQQNKGFTISELLMATIILLLVSGMLTTCILLGMNQLNKETQESEAQMLCTMLATKVQDELSYASGANFTDLPEGRFLSFAKAGKTEKVGFYITAKTDGDTDTDFYRVTDSEANAKSYLGKIYLASRDDSDHITNPEGLVSDGSYNIKNGSYGSLQAGMRLIETSGGYEVIIEVYNSTDTPTLLASKDFYVGKVATDVSADISVNVEKYTIIFDANGGKFGDGSTQIVFADQSPGAKINVPAAPHKDGVEFKGWNPSVTESFVTVSKDVTYTAIWSSYTARFYAKSSDIDLNHPGNNTVASLSADYGGKIIGGTVNNVTIEWPGFEANSTLPTTLHRDNFVFDGWVDQAGNIYYPAKGDTWPFTKDEYFVAHYSPADFTIEFYNGSTKVAERTAQYNSSSNSYTFDALSNLDLSHYASEDWTFKGWYLNRTSPVGMNDAKTAIPASDISEALNNSTDRKIKLYAGYTNTKRLFYKADALSTGHSFLIIGGDEIGDNRPAMSYSGNNIADATKTVKGQEVERYVLANNGNNNDDWYLDNTGYIRTHLNSKILDVEQTLLFWYSLTLRNSNSSTQYRTWTYQNKSLDGYWLSRTGWFPDDHYIYYSSSGFNITGSKPSNGNVHIYDLKEIGEGLSFNGIEP